MDLYIIEAERGLKATPDEYEALKAVLYPDDEADEALDDDEYHSFEIEYRNEEVHIFCWEGGGTWRALPSAFLTLLGALIAKNGLKYLEFGVAWVSPPNVGGTYFRIRSNGSLWEPKLYWRAMRRHKRRRQTSERNANEAKQVTNSQQTEITKQGSSEVGARR